MGPIRNALSTTLAEDAVRSGRATVGDALQIRFRASTNLSYNWITMNGLGNVGDLEEPVPVVLREEWELKLQRFDLRHEPKHFRPEFWDLRASTRLFGFTP